MRVEDLGTARLTQHLPEKKEAGSRLDRERKEGERSEALTQTNDAPGGAGRRGAVDNNRGIEPWGLFERSMRALQSKKLKTSSMTPQSVEH